MNRDDTFHLLKKLGAPNRLVRHAELVSGVAAELASEFQALGIACDANLIEAGSVLHDVGKILHPQELSQSGSQHESVGKALLLANGVAPEIANICVSHAAWDSPGPSFEEHIVALADKLWKGKREEPLELAVIDQAAAKLGVSRWDIFERLDSVFEKIASGATERLERSRTPSG
jgi:putative nucleotidyltransferase with HDIG domain